VRSTRVRKFWIGSALLLICGLVVLTLCLMRPESPQIIGNLYKRDVAEIRKAIWRKRHPPLLPNWSSGSLVQVPGLLWHRIRASKERIFRTEVRNEQFVAVLGRSMADAKEHKYVFWCVFRDSKGWVAEAEYRLTENRFEP